MTENARVIEAVPALEGGDLRRLGALMAASHASMRDDFAISLPAIDEIVARLARLLGTDGGVRMTGGGFGGNLVAIAPNDAFPAMARAIAALDVCGAGPLRIYPVTASVGVRLVRGGSVAPAR